MPDPQTPARALPFATRLRLMTGPELTQLAIRHAPSGRQPDRSRAAQIAAEERRRAALARTMSKGFTDAS